MKKALFPTGKVRLDRQVYRVTYEARKVTEDQNYPVLSKLATGKRCIFDIGANMSITALIMALVMHPDR